MVGHLIQYLQNLEKQGMTREEIIDKYVFFTAGSCGPCRFGMYEAEYRLAVQNAGFDGFRILLFQQTDGIKAASGEPGLKFTVDFGLGALDALNLGDIMNDITYQIRPFEVNAGETDRVMKEVMAELSAAFRDRPPFEIMERARVADPVSRRARSCATRSTRSASCEPLVRPPDEGGAGGRRGEAVDDRGGSAAREAGRQDHRRVLRADDRGRRQLQDVPVPRARGRRRSSSSRSATGSCTCCGRRASGTSRRTRKVKRPR
jgi:hypothetical protein